jgi:Glu-tRNA(Gln) amidotransferase subunit E-like FAD-binding protein
MKDLTKKQLKKIVREEVERLSAEQIVKVIWGDYDRPRGGSALAKLTSKALERFFDTKSQESIVFTSEVISRELEKLGFSREEIREIREAVTKSAEAAYGVIADKYGLTDDMMTTIGSNFQIHSPFLSVPQEARREFWERSRDLSIRRIQRLGYR